MVMLKYKMTTIPDVYIITATFFKIKYFISFIDTKKNIMNNTYGIRHHKTNKLLFNYLYKFNMYKWLIVVDWFPGKLIL